MPSALVHIGMHKTGSSYLQGICKANLDVLAAQGVHVISRAPRDDTRRLRQLLRDGLARPEDALWEPVKLTRALERAPRDSHLFLTCESLEGLGRCPRSQQHLDALLRERYESVSYVLVVRDVLDHAASVVQQGIKAMQRLKYRGIEKSLANWSLSRKLGALVDGPYRLEVIDFDEIIKGDTPARLAELFCTNFGIDRVVLQDIPPANESIGAEGVAFMLAMGHLVRGAIGGPPPPLLKWPRFRAIQRHNLAAIRQRLDTRSRFMPFSAELQRSTIARVREENASFVRRFPGPWAERVFSGRERSMQIVLLGELPAARRKEIEALILDTWERVVALLGKDFGLERGFSAQDALSAYLREERDILL